MITTRGFIFDTVLQKEGGRVDHTVKGDIGGQTYGGISRKFNADFPGWQLLDEGRSVPDEMLFERYLTHYWEPLGLDMVHSLFPELAAVIFDFGFVSGIGNGRAMLRHLCPNPNIAAALGGLASNKKARLLIRAERYRTRHHIKKSDKQFVAGHVERGMSWNDLFGVIDNL